jgi:diguanylate cyclase (GGDEF)-like protein/putative nucleotidyltransferase with HDIG domain
MPLDALLEAAPVALAVYDARGRMMRANQRLADLLGGVWTAPGMRRSSELVDRVLASGESAYDEDTEAGAAKDRHWHWECHPIRLADGTLAGALVVVEDVTDATRLQKKAQTDPLTGILNHGAFHDRLGTEVERARRHGHPLTLALIDLDEFKVINDTFGHQAGDRVLVDVVSILFEHIRATDVPGRIGGDEFALLMPETDRRGGAVIAERVNGAVGAATVGDGQRVTLSVGVCELEEAEGPEELLRYADRALYWSKTHGRDTVSRYSPQSQDVHGALASIGISGRLARGQAAAAVRALARAMDLKDSATRQHSDRVAELSARLAEELAWPRERTELLREAALVHDVGKVAIPDAVLLKPGGLTAAEIAVVQRHCEMGAQIAREILTEEQTAWLRGHHERFDGTGYPDGLAGDEVPDGARILAAAEAYDVMVSDRPYRCGRDPVQALEELRRCAGTQFAPEIVETFEGPRFVRLARFHSNQERRRAANRTRGAAPDGHLELLCECWNPQCTARLDVASDELQAARAHQRRFVVADRHDRHDLERVVARTPRFVIVEKRV